MTAGVIAAAGGGASCDRGRHLTERAVRNWAAATGASVFDLRLVPEDLDAARPITRTFTADTLLRSVGWLRFVNRSGFHIYARPLDDAVVLVDDLCLDGLDRMHHLGHRPCAIVETSPANYQAWIRVAAPDTPISLDVAGVLGRVAARVFDGDRGATGRGQVGRLPGAVQRKEIHRRRDGTHPFVRLRAAVGGVDPGGHRLLALARAEVERLRPDPDRVRPSVNPSNSRYARIRPVQPAEEYREALRRVTATLVAGHRIDRSRVDHAIARRLAERGADQSYIEAVLRAGDRTAGMRPDDVDGYILRTLEAAALTTHPSRGCPSTRWRGAGEPSDRTINNFVDSPPPPPDRPSARRPGVHRVPGESVNNVGDWPCPGAIASIRFDARAGVVSSLRGPPGPARTRPSRGHLTPGPSDERIHE